MYLGIMEVLSRTEKCLPMIGEPKEKRCDRASHTPYFRVRIYEIFYRNQGPCPYYVRLFPRWTPVVTTDFGREILDVRICLGPEDNVRKEPEERFSLSLLLVTIHLLFNILPPLKKKDLGICQNMDGPGGHHT